MKTYNILELQKMKFDDLIDIADLYGMIVLSGTSKQNLIYQILDRQEKFINHNSKHDTSNRL